jgi:methylated-DNA-[protein]-cysteine S-methyltransferase
MGTVERTVVLTPIGGIGLAVDNGAVVGVSFGADPAAGFAPVTSAVLADAVHQLEEYCAGTRMEFELPLMFERGSDFERAVWKAIAEIPYGETQSYGAIARSVGEPGGAQAVGLACNRNPLPIIVACHRVIGSDGKLVGFGGGLDRKRWLLQLEARVHIEHEFSAGLG